MWVVILIFVAIAMWMSDVSSSNRSTARSQGSVRKPKPKGVDSKPLEIKELSDNSAVHEDPQVTIKDYKNFDSLLQRSQAAEITIAGLKAQLAELDERASNKPVISAARFGIEERHFQFIDLGNSEDQVEVERNSDYRDESWCSKFVEQNDIKVLIHFTSFDNIQSIMQRGLVTRSKLNGGAVHGHVNDELRLDGHPDYISVSITFPNYKMFYKYRKMSEGKSWVVLEIDPSVLWNNDCLFCRHNAADKRILRTSVDELKTLEAFSSLFVDEDGGGGSRHSMGLLPADPTDPQAEVLVFAGIPVDKILAVNFEDDSVHARFKADYPEIISRVNRRYFQSRSYVR